MEDNWMDGALCRELPPETFFPADGAGVEEARRICAGCPVREECLDYALRNRVDHGVWGGESERGRHRILRRRSNLELVPAEPDGVQRPGHHAARSAPR